MFKWIRIKMFLKKMRKKHNRIDFEIVTSEKEMIIYITGEEDELRLRW
jgi:hypothetical protein